MGGRGSGTDLDHGPSTGSDPLPSTLDRRWWERRRVLLDPSVANLTAKMRPSGPSDRIDSRPSDPAIDAADTGHRLIG